MSEEKVQKGDKIKVEYEGKLDSGELFDTSNREGQQQPIEFTVGERQVIKGFDDAVIDMKIGDEKEFKIKSEEAYGPKRDELQREVPRNQLPQDQEPKEGMMLVMQGPEGQQFPAKIVKVDEDKITIDLNHPLAGQDLTFNIKIAGIEKGKTEEKKE